MDTEQIQQLRRETGAGIMDVKNALKETSGDFEKARDILRKRGSAIAAKKSAREAGEGGIFSYLHAGNRIGVLLKLYCETDFVARTEEFKALGRDLAMHIAASDPEYVNEQDVPQEVLETERRIYGEQIADSGKADNIIDQIIEGKMKKFTQEVVLLEQFYIKDSDRTIRQIIEDTIAKLGENIRVGDFVRYEL